MNTNSIDATGARAFVEIQKSAVQNTSHSVVRKLTFLLLWLSVSAPLAWGVFKAWQDVRILFN
jgi:hypothetical protein